MNTKKVIFKGDFWEYFFKTLLLSLLVVVTFGLATPYLFYWQFKYFFAHIEIEA